MTHPGPDSLNGIKPSVEIVNPELIEVAEDDILRAVGDEANPVIERLAVMLAQVRAALLHLDQDDGLPDVVGETGPAAIFGCLANAKLGSTTDVEGTFLAEGAKEVVEEDLSFAFFVPRDVRGGPVDEILKDCFSGLPGVH
jgi:hypothetical protein